MGPPAATNPEVRPKTALAVSLVFLGACVLPLASLVWMEIDPCEGSGHDCWGEGFAWLFLLAMAPFAIAGVGLAAAALYRWRTQRLPALRPGTWSVLSIAAWLLGVPTALLAIVFALPRAAMDWIDPALAFLGPLLSVVPLTVVVAWWTCAVGVAGLAYRRPPASGPTPGRRVPP
jgi:hypothetical protein